MPGAGNLTDRGDDLLIIDNPPAVVPGNCGGCCRDQVNRNTNALPLLALAPAYADAAHQDEAADSDRVTRARCGQFVT